MRKLKIMIVDGDGPTTERYKKEIGDAYQVDFFPTAELALMDFENASYDLVAINFTLPAKSGEALVFDLKYLNPFQKTILIAEADDFLSLKDSHEVQVFTKPVNIKDVVDIAVKGRGVSRAESRRHPRFKVDLPSNIVDDASHSRAQVKVLNISMGGLFIGADHTLSLQSDIFSLELPILGQQLVIKAKRRWEINLTESLVGIGAEFHDLGHEEYSLVEKFLDTFKS